MSRTKRSGIVDYGEVMPHERLQQRLDFFDDAIPSQYTKCNNIPPPQRPQHPMNPLLAASMPGNHAELMKFLVEGSTGVFINTGSLRNDVVAVNTHHPYYQNHASVEALVSSTVDQSVTQHSENAKTTARALILLRDPLDTVESWMDWVRNNPQKNDEYFTILTEDWVNWRDRHFKTELRQV